MSFLKNVRTPEKMLMCHKVIGKFDRQPTHHSVILK